MKPPPAFGAILGVWFLIWGVLTIQAAIFPTKNSLTKAIYWMSTIMPRMGSMTDETWVMVNGVVLLVLGVDTTILGLTIGTSSMKDVEATLGKANVLPLRGSASASRTICFSSPTDGTILTFGTNGMGGFVDLVEF